MALEFEGIAALVKSFVPIFMALRARSSEVFAAKRKIGRHAAECAVMGPAASVGLLSPAAEAALAPLDLPPDGPFDPTSILRAKLTPEVAACNFVRWARALDLVGHYSKRSIYALYCEFSEVDQRPPLPDRHFFEALAQTEGVRKEQLRIDCGNGKFRRPWQWTVELAAKVEVTEAVAADAREAETPTEVCLLEDTQSTKVQEPPARLLAPTKPTRPPANLLRFIADEGHPFSPAGLREQAKHARRARLNAAASRKQRGPLRRAA